MRIERVERLSDEDRATLLDFWVRGWQAAIPSIDFLARRDWMSAHLDALMAEGAWLLVTRMGETEAPRGLLTVHPGTGTVDQLAVDPDFGGRGIARALIGDAKRLCPAGLNLRVTQINERAVALYRRLGFIVTGEDVSVRSGLAVWTMAWPGDGTRTRSPPVAVHRQRWEKTLDAGRPGREEPFMDLTLSAAQALVAAALSHAREKAMKPLVVVVLDARGVVKAAAAEDGTSLKRFEIAQGKAHGALALGMGSRSIAKRAVDQAYFVAAVTHVVGGNLVPVAGGVLLRGPDGAVVGAAGASGDTSDDDEAAVMAGIAVTGLKGDPGQD